MRKVKWSKVKTLAPAVFFLHLFFLWSFLLGVPSAEPTKLLWVALSVILLTVLFLKNKALREVLYDGDFWVLSLAAAITVIFAKLGEVFNWFHLNRCGVLYYLLFVGAVHGPLFKTFLRKKKKTLYVLLFINTLSLLFASLNPFVVVAYLISNLISADLYTSRRDSYAELIALVVGNGVFATISGGYFLLDNPDKVVLVPLFYALSVVTGAFILFGLQKLIDLIPFMFSDEKLEAIANLSNPLVEEMLLKAPGTYHHSLMVSLLSESLAKKLGADPLITKVGAMFHDIGKLVNPQYFIENVNGKNPHDELKPEVSASIIKSHVSEGIALARKYHLPEEVIRFIPEHQGTKLIKYFYAKAREQNGSAKEEKFRYPGPIPQSKETALVMIADTVEAMVRALKNPSPDEIRKTVARAMELLKEEGQLKDSGLTDKDLKKAEKLLSDLLISYYHERIKYPEKGEPTKKG